MESALTRFAHGLQGAAVVVAATPAGTAKQSHGQLGGWLDPICCGLWDTPIVLHLVHLIVVAHAFCAVFSERVEVSETGRGGFRTTITHKTHN